MVRITVSLALAVTLLLGCSMVKQYDGVDVNSVRKVISVTVAELRAANFLLADLVKRKSISVTTAQKVLDGLESARQSLVAANEAVEQLDVEASRSHLDAAIRILDITLAVMAPYVDHPAETYKRGLSAPVYKPKQHGYFMNKRRFA